jgi:hypothetical protein
MDRKILIFATPPSQSEPFDVLSRLVGVVLTTLRVEGEHCIVSATEVASALLDRSDKDTDAVDVADDWRAARHFACRPVDEIDIPLAVCKPIG